MVKVKFIKILFTGSGAAGKTSFINLLMKNKFINFHHSTNTVQAKHDMSVRKAVVSGSCQSDDQNVVWLEMNDDLEISHFRQILLSLDISSLQIVQFVKQMPLPSGVQWVTGLFQGSVKIKKLAIYNSLVQSSIESNNFQHEFSDHGEVFNIITLLDTGGQPEYIHLLPIVNIHPTVNFVIHDLSKSLGDLKYSNFDMIKFLISRTNESLENASSPVPQLVTIPGKNNMSYLCCVGTHADKVSSGTIHNVDRQLTAMVENLDCKARIWQNKDHGVLFPVDNTTAGNEAKEDPIAKFIRNKINQLGKDKDIYELPITWMLLELEIRKVCSDSGKAYMSFKECCSIAHQTNLIRNIEEVRNALIYHHYLGVLLYYADVPGLCDYVIIDHQWLFDRISSIMCFTFKHSSNMLAINSNGILTNELIQELERKEEVRED